MLKKLKFPLIFFLFLLPAKLSFGQLDTIFKVLTVNQVDEGVLVNFTIRGGITCSGVTIQKSSDGINYENVYEFSGICGAPSTDETYNYTDTDPVINNISYYRLDLASLHIYSEVISITFIDYRNGALVLPNPCRNDCKVYFVNKTGDAHEIKLFNSSGNIILNDLVEDDFWQLPEVALPPGYYHFVIYRESEVLYSGKIAIL